MAFCPKCGGKIERRYCRRCGPLPPPPMLQRRPISLTDRQLALVQRHAAALPVDQRDGFLRDVAARLTDAPSDDAVAQAINVALDRRAGALWR